MIIVNAKTFSALHASLKLIEMDNGGHLIGTVYPGDPINLNEFSVPERWKPLLDPAEQGLSRLRALSESEWETFVAGDQDEGDAIRMRHGDLRDAAAVLADFFNGWEAVDPETRCLACFDPLCEGDEVYNDASGELIHAKCCGPERESYTGANGDPLGECEPIPSPWKWHADDFK